MDENGTSKDLADGKKHEGGRLQPVRIHELLGIPKSTGKPQKMSQPVRIKDLFKSTSSCEKSYPSERRMTLARGRVTNARRQLYDTSVRATPENASSTTARLPENSETIAAELRGNAGSQVESRSVQLGISKSEGKHFTDGHAFRQPERVKDLMESWEKSQTVKRQVRKSVMGDLRPTSVRRKLYNAPSTVAVPPIVQKSQKNSVPQRRSVKSNRQKSSQIQPRRSCLLPPNSIRDKHINRQQNDTIKEESPASLLNESEKNDSEISKKSARSEKIQSSLEKLQIEASSEPEEKSASDDEVAPRRPTVIITAASIKKMCPEKNSNRSSADKKSPFAIFRAPFKELDRKSFPKHRLDAATSSIEDLLGDSRPDGELPIGDLPCNSFLDRPPIGKNSGFNVDEQTVRWMKANLKLAIQSAEENLFVLKKILRSLEEIGDESSIAEIDSEFSAARNEAEIPGAATIDPNRSAKIDDLPELPIVAETPNDEEKIGDENKENVFVGATIEISGRRRSARLAALEIGKSPKNSDDSFSAIERELNIVHDKSKAATPRVATPGERRKIDPRSRRSMREYMALKSMVNCLQTPDVKGAPTPKGENKDLSKQIRAKRSISRTLMNELDDLYADSPQ